MKKEAIKNQKEQIISQLKEYAPLFAPFFEMDATLAEYSSTINTFNRNKVYIERQKQIKNNIKQKFKTIFPKDYKDLNIDFDDQWSCNIVDHHQILNHPLLISSNIISSVDKFLQNKKQTATIAISSGDIPPNNYFIRNGFEIHNKRVPIFTNKEKEYSSNLLAKRDFDFFKNIKLAKRLGDFNKEEIEFLQKEQAWIQNLDFSGCKNYSDQVSVIVKNQWPRMFEAKLRPNLPDLLYITQEEITSMCLLDLLDEDNLVSYTLFNKKFRDKIIEDFSGIAITWNKENSKGSHFFWRKHPNEPRSLRLSLKGNKLVPTDERYKDLAFDFEPATIRNLLNKGEIYPSLFTVFLVLNFYYGIKPLVGQASLTYIKLMREKWINILPESDYANEIDNIKSYDIDKLITGIIIFFEKQNDSLKTLWAYDIIEKGGIDENYLKKLFNVPFKDLLSTAIVGIYDYIAPNYIPKEKRIKTTINSDQLADLTFDWL